MMAPPEVSIKLRVGGLELGEEIDRGDGVSLPRVRSAPEA